MALLSVACCTSSATNSALGMIASTNTYENVRLDLGSSPIVDHLMGSKSFSIVHDGAAYRRVDKVRRVAANPLATKSARVCWQRSSWSRNCGVCEKCIQTQLDFLAVGKTNPECFDRPLDLRLIKKISPTSPTRLRDSSSCSKSPKDRQSEPWRVALQQAASPAARQTRVPCHAKWSSRYFGVSL